MVRNKACAATAALLATGLADSPVHASTPEERLAQLLVANDIAALCADNVQRKGGRTAHELIADGLIMIINDTEFTMSHLMEVRQTTSPARLRMLKEAELTRRGIDLRNHRDVCFFAQQVLGPSDPIGRYLEAR